MMIVPHDNINCGNPSPCSLRGAGTDVSLREHVLFPRVHIRYRDTKQREENKKHEAAIAKKKAEAASSAEEKRKAALVEEMEGKEYTFDTDGRVIWIDQPDPNK